MSRASKFARAVKAAKETVPVWTERLTKDDDDDGAVPLVGKVSQHGRCEMRMDGELVNSMSARNALSFGRWLVGMFGVLILLAGAGETVIPLTPEHWRDAPATVIEHETGVPAAVIDQERAERRVRDPYPSIPSAPELLDVQRPPRPTAQRAE